VSARCYGNVVKCLALLDDIGIRGTFFVQGYVAEQRPEVVRLISSQGHEIASHGRSHRPVYAMTEKEFESELRTSKSRLEDISGQEVCAFRAPNFSIRNDTSWAFSVLAECGFTIDSSMFPVRMGRYGNPGHSLGPSRVGPENAIRELPVSILALGSSRIPVGGGGYARLLPYSFLKWSLTRINSEGRPFVFYCHPYEFAPDEWKDIPEKVPAKVRIRHGWGRRKHLQKLRKFLLQGPFGTVSNALDQMDGL